MLRTFCLASCPADPRELFRAFDQACTSTGYDSLWRKSAVLGLKLSRMNEYSKTHKLRLVVEGEHRPQMISSEEFEQPEKVR